MFASVITFPVIDPVLWSFGPIAIRWYALAYIFGLVGGWLYARRLVSQAQLWGDVKRPSVASLDDLLVYVAFGVILGGRIGYVLFYNLEHFMTYPADIIAVWNGGMSFHGGLAGAALGIWLFARRNAVGVLSVTDLCSTVVPIGLLFGRIANFIKPELWGRATDVPWAMVFPDAGPIARHPSQLYEAGLEGLLLLVILYVLARRGGFRNPGYLTGVFGVGYGLARIFCEFFREPDPQLGFLFGQFLAGNATMGMLLSVPLVLAGIWLIVQSRPQAQVGEAR
jgi:phosphatidylglycerol:prolipoprotein diacylglycerol transferase